MNYFVNKGDTILLQGVTSVKLYIDEEFKQHLYTTTGTSIHLKVDEFIGNSIISEGVLYPLSPDHDNDFYIIVT